jgi:hypothetical protein
MSAPDVDHRYELFRAPLRAAAEKRESLVSMVLVRSERTAAVYWNYAWLQQPARSGLRWDAM